MCLMAIAGVVSAVGTIASASAQAAGEEARARYAQRQSVLEREKGAYEAERLERSNDRKLASMRGQYLSSGISLEGSPSDVIADSATEASLDEQAIKFGAQVRADNYVFESRLAQQNARAARTGGMIGALGDVVGGFAQQRSYNQQRTMIRNPYSF